MKKLLKLYSLLLFTCILFSCKDSKNNTVEIENISTPSSFSITSLSTKQLEVSVGPENITQEYTLIYKSSDNSIVTVSANGLLTAQNGGSAIISVYVEGHEDISSKTMVTVVPFTLNAEESINMKIGESVQIMATLYPIPSKSCTLSWTSSNPNVATVDNSGNVTGVSVGSSTIQISLNEIPEITIKSNITVSETYKDPSIHEIYVTPLDTFNISKSINTTQPFKYQSKDESIVKIIDNKEAVALQDGHTYIYAYLNEQTEPYDSLYVYAISTIEIPDANFRKRIITLYDTNKDNLIQINEISTITTLSITNLKIADLTGIEYFTSLESLNCSYNLLESLDVSKNNKLQKLYCYYNSLKKIDVSNDTLLNYLHCGYNDLLSIDISSNNALVTFNCTNNEISTLNLSQNTKITSFTCSNNNIESLDLSANTLLSTFVCTNNNITALDLSNNLKISTLTCNNNLLTEIIFNETKNHSLSSFNCENNKLETLNLATCKSIVSLYAGSNRLTSIDFSKSTKLQTISCEFNKLNNLDLSNQISLIQLICNNNNLTSLITNSPTLTKLWCQENALTELAIANNTALLQLLCQNNKLVTIDLSKNTALRNIILSHNQLSSLDITHNSDISFLNCMENPLTTLYCAKNADQGAWSIPSSTIVVLQ